MQLKNSTFFLLHEKVTRHKFRQKYRFIKYLGNTIFDSTSRTVIASVRHRPSVKTQWFRGRKEKGNAYAFTTTVIYSCPKTYRLNSQVVLDIYENLILRPKMPRHVNRYCLSMELQFLPWL